MGYKKERLGPRLVHAARSRERYRDLHAFIGGTGAVGGTALLQMLSMYEEMMGLEPPEPDDVPVLLATGKGKDDIQAFTQRLFRFCESRHGSENRPHRIKSGYLTHSGVFVALERFQLSSLPAPLEEVRKAGPAGRGEALGRLVDTLAAPGESRAAAFFRAVAEARPMSSHLRAYLEKHFKGGPWTPFRSVVIGIPIPSLAAYHQDDLAAAARSLGLPEAEVEEVRGTFLKAFEEDLQAVGELAETVLVAHTTAVGGMYDEDGDHHRTIRLGFAHSAQDDRLKDKQRFAEKLAVDYAAMGTKMLITAAAIGVDEVRLRAEIPLHFQVSRRLHDEPEELFPGAKRLIGGADGRALRHVVRVFPPLTVPLDGPPDGQAGEARFEAGEPLRPTYSIRSGENGFFSVANADALYRVMRVATASELGLVLATVGLLGDDPNSPWFPPPGNTCHYTETDNSRQVFDLLAQPSLRAGQLSGLEPMALQDLGSAKHQGELHTLSLLILLHRLRTLDIDAIDPYVDLERFDPDRFIAEHSRALTFEDLAHWPFADLAREMQILASAERAEDLAVLNPGRHSGLFPLKDRAQTLVFERALRAVWMVPSLGSPILYERDGTTFVRTGYFAAPLDLLVSRREALSRHLRQAYEESANPCSYEEFRDFHLASGGFVDLRPLAILTTARNDRADLRGQVHTFRDEAALERALLGLEPYAPFTTCGLVALHYRLTGLYAQLREAMLELGSLHEYRWHMPRDDNGHILLLPGIVEALRMVAEGLEKSTGTERLDGPWGYRRRPAPARWKSIPGVES